jgi:hypothetical protein
VAAQLPLVSELLVGLERQDPVLGQLPPVGTDLLKVGEFEDRLASLEATIKHRGPDPELDDPIGKS